MMWARQVGLVPISPRHGFPIPTDLPVYPPEISPMNQSAKKCGVERDQCRLVCDKTADITLTTFASVKDEASDVCGNISPPACWEWLMTSGRMYIFPLLHVWVLFEIKAIATVCVQLSRQ